MTDIALTLTVNTTDIGQLLDTLTTAGYDLDINLETRTMTATQVNGGKVTCHHAPPTTAADATNKPATPDNATPAKPSGNADDGTPSKHNAPPPANADTAAHGHSPAHASSEPTPPAPHAATPPQSPTTSPHA